MSREREHREWWAIDNDRILCVTGYSCAPSNPDCWWVPQLGSSLSEKFHLFPTKEEATTKLVNELNGRIKAAKAMLSHLAATPPSDGQGGDVSVSPKQSAIMNALARNAEITTAQATELIGGDLYANASFHVGNILSRMVKRGLIVRVRRGVFKLPERAVTVATLGAWWQP